MYTIKTTQLNRRFMVSTERPNNNNVKKQMWRKCRLINANKYLKSSNKSVTLFPPSAAAHEAYTDTPLESGSLT